MADELISSLEASSLPSSINGLMEKGARGS